MSNLDLSIVVQGIITEESLDFYLTNYKNFNLIFSIWDDNTVDLSKINCNIKLIISKKNQLNNLESKLKINNIHYLYQVISTLKGLNECQSKYVIKIRGDEYISNIEYLYSILDTNQKTLYTTPIFFRPWSKFKFHISDHIIAGTRENLLSMFNTALKKIESLESNEYLFLPEQELGIAYLKSREDEVGDSNGLELIKKHFNILNLEHFKPYLMVANCFNKKFYGDFVPEEWGAISKIQDLG